MDYRILTAAMLPAALLAQNMDAQQKRPNILFAFADDMGRHASIYADREPDNIISQIVNTPNFDRVAREGVLFTNAHAPAPCSTPCRSSLCSGMYFWRTGAGAFLEGARWDTSIPTFPLILEESGYHIGYSYKVWSPGFNRDAPYGGYRNRYQKAGNLLAKYSIHMMNTAPEDREAKKEEILSIEAENFRQFLADRKEGEPFCYWWGPTTTHREWARGSGKEIWGLDPDKLEGKLPPSFPDDPQVRMDLTDYLGEVQAVDAGLGVLISVLEEIGELDNTIIVLSGDQGLSGFPRSKVTLYNSGTLVNLFIRYPKAIKKGRVVDDVVNLMDLAATFLDYGECEIPKTLDAKTLRPVLESRKSGQVDPERTWAVTGRERHVANARKDFLPYPQRAIVNKDFKYIRNFAPNRWPHGSFDDNLRDFGNGPTKEWYIKNWKNPDAKWYVDMAFAKRPYEELYDLRNDPDEINNLAYDPNYQEVRKDLSDRLDKVLRKSQDPRMDEGVCLFDSPSFILQTMPDNEYTAGVGHAKKNRADTGW